MRCIDCKHLWSFEDLPSNTYFCAAKSDRMVHEVERNAYCSWFKRKTTKG